MGELTPGICALTLNKRTTNNVRSKACEKAKSSLLDREEKTILVNDVLRLYKNQQEAE